ncbi:MAG: TonB-dependent receptor [Planctomycetaceae bacterium]
MNGVINIITKKAKDTQGTMISTGAGSEDRAITSIRQGGEIQENMHYRVYAKQVERDAMEANHRFIEQHGNRIWEEAHDDSRQQRIGFRMDWDMNGNGDELFTLQGDYYQGNSGFSLLRIDPFTPHHSFNEADDYHIFGGNVLGRYTRRYDEDTSSTLQAYYDSVNRDSLITDTSIHVFDIELNNTCSPFDGHDVTWGGRYRAYYDEIDDKIVQVNYAGENDFRNLGAIFIQDEFDLIDDTLRCWIGTKLEHNNYTGIEHQPSVRLLWTLNEREVIWGAVSRATRTPNRTEETAQFTTGIHNDIGLTNQVLYYGSRNLEGENVVAYELGYRTQPEDWYSWDIAAFYNEFDSLIVGNGPVVQMPDASTLLYVYNLDNAQKGHSYGFEIANNVEVTDWWEISSGFSYVLIFLESHFVTGQVTSGEDDTSPNAQFYTHSSFDLTDHLQLDLFGRFVDEYPFTPELESGYFEMNARLGYRPNEEWEFALMGTNLLNPSHKEADQFDLHTNRPERGIFGQVIWRH